MKRCSACVLPGSTPHIVFNEEGVCNFCLSHSPPSFPGAQALLQVIEENRRPDSKYDCLVAISGGRDSTYALLKLAKDHNQKVLAVNYENPFTHPRAALNIKNAVKALNVKLLTYRLQGDWHQRVFRDNLTAWLRHPSPVMIPMLCMGCRSLEWELVRIAKQNRVYCIVGAVNQFEDSIFKKVLLGVPGNTSYGRAIVRGLPIILREIEKSPAYLNLPSLGLMVRGHWALLQDILRERCAMPKIKKLSIFSFVEWDEKEILSRISSELGWEYPRERASSWRFDCRVGMLKKLMYKRTLGMTENDDFYSQMIREGKMNREEALRRIEAEGSIDYQQIEALLRETGIDPTSFWNRLPAV